MRIQAEELYDLIYSFKDYAKEASIIQDFIHERLPQAKTILDVACGTGKHIQILSKSFQVDGIDLNPRYIEIAGQRNPSSTFWCQDMTTFELDRKYDLILCLFSAIAYAKTYSALTQTFRQMKKHLNRGGIVMIEPWFTPKNWKIGHVTVVNGQSHNIQVCRMSHSDRAGKISILNFEYLVGTKDGITHFTETHEMGLFSADEMQSAFQEAGFEVEYDPVGVSGRGLYITKPVD